VSKANFKFSWHAVKPPPLPSTYTFGQRWAGEQTNPSHGLAISFLAICAAFECALLGAT
jgi:hypothetical protein